MPTRWRPRRAVKAAISATRTAAGRKAGRLGAPVPTHLGIPDRSLREADLHGLSFRSLACRHDVSRQDLAGPRAWARITSTKQPTALPHILYPSSPKRPRRHGPTKRSCEARQDRAEQADLARLLGDAGGRGRASSRSIWTVVTEVVGAALKGITAADDGGLGRDQRRAGRPGAQDAGGFGQGAKPVYVTGGMLYQLNEDGTLASREGSSGGGGVCCGRSPTTSGRRRQSLGVGKCTVCHSTNSPFFFGKVGRGFADCSPSASLTKAAVRVPEKLSARPHLGVRHVVHLPPVVQGRGDRLAAVIGIVLLLYGLQGAGRRGQGAVGTGVNY